MSDFELTVFQGKLDVENLYLSGYITDADGPQDCIENQNDLRMVTDALLSGIEEADARIISNVAAAIKDRLQWIVILSNDTGVLILLLHYFRQFSLMGVQQLWIKYSQGDKSCYIPIHTLADKLGVAYSSRAHWM